MSNIDAIGSTSMVSWGFGRVRRVQFGKLICWDVFGTKFAILTYQQPRWDFLQLNGHQGQVFGKLCVTHTCAFTLKCVQQIVNCCG